MILRSKEAVVTLPKDTPTGLVDIQDVGDQTIMTHVENVTDVLKEAQEIREFSDNGFTKTREMRQIGLIPMSIFIQHPEFSNDPEAIKKWLNSDEGQRFRTVKGRV